MDRYTKVMLTIIALVLSGILVQNTILPAIAIGDGCGSSYNPCYIRVTNDIEVRGRVRTD